MQKPAHRVVRQHPAVELLTHQRRCLAAQHALALRQVGLELVEDGLNLPALVVQRRQFQRRRVLRVQQGRQQPVARLRIVQPGQGVLDDAHHHGPGRRLLSTQANGVDGAQVGAVVQHAMHRQLAVAHATPQQLRPGGLRLAPVLETVEPPVGQAQHSRLQPGQERLKQLPLVNAKGPQVGAQDRVRGALNHNHTSRLRVAGVAGAAARVAEMRRVVSLARQLEGAVNGDEPQAGIERVGVRLGIGHGHTAALDQFTHRRRADLAAQAGGVSRSRRICVALHIRGFGLRTPS